jgi:hypothetical protein
VAAASFALYEGAVGILVDAKVWVDCIDKAGPRHGWVIEQRQTCSECAALHVSTVNYS